MSLEPDDLVLCAGSLGPATLREKLDAAAAAGFGGVSIFIHELAQSRAEGFGEADVRHLAADLGLGLAELDPLLTWLPEAGAPQTSDTGSSMGGFGIDDFLDVGEALGVRSINAALVGSEPVGPDAMAEGFAALCDRAAERGLLVSLEFVAFAQLRDLAAAVDVVERAGRANGGVMFDTIHQLRSGGSHALLERVAARVNGIQLNDVAAQPEPDPVAETLHRRLLPGEGDADTVGQLRALAAGGCRAPIGVEVFSDVLNALAPAEAARRCIEATRKVLAEARA
ncbi:MAG: sugar phosphate isomerase/epimerase [Deltaproteobacteria bacterium]|nr:sugar phosphate isomerase/epimerase [Deltaproteobacteria bacterium]MBW2362466.1 sugar phosphate isomerase/epimerase [Deltaproteobacteria bacterium]